MSGQVPYVSQSVGMTAADAQQVGTDQTVVASTTSLTDINKVVRVEASLTGASITGNCAVSGNVSASSLAVTGAITFSSINSTPIGATTPSTGAFTALSASVAGTASTVPLLIQSPTSDATIRFKTTSGTAGMNQFEIRSVGVAGYDGLQFRYVNDANTLFTQMALISPAGLAVTGNISSTTRTLVGTTTDDGVNALQVNGSVQASGTVTSSILAATKSGPALLYVTDTTSPASQLLISSASGVNTRIGTTTTHNIDFFINSATKMTLSSTGLAVTGNISSSGTITPQQATTAGAPAYVKGAIYFDTTLNKLRVGGATAWETITSI